MVYIIGSILTAQSHISSTQYVGRFAPSPSGPLHFGSLVTALGSYIQAKFNGGKWLLRIEDLDPPREVAGASDDILRCLERHHLYWDDELVYQSQRMDIYQQKIDWLLEKKFGFYCQCTRANLNKLRKNSYCPCFNQHQALPNNAVRFKHLNPIRSFDDKLLGKIEFQLNELPNQFAIKRKDGLIAYQLAVVVDDIQQGITEVARGADLLPATVFQLALYRAFDCVSPDFLHFPVVVSETGRKLSKQNHAPAIHENRVMDNLVAALGFLGLPVNSDMFASDPETILAWAIENWDLKKLVAKTEQIDNRIAQADSI